MGTGSFDFLDFLLKWAAVSYGLGFVTVTVNTARLGIPAIEVLEPVLVCVGAPLALIFLIVIAISKRYRSSVDALRAELIEITRDFEVVRRLSDAGQIEEACNLLTRLLLRSSMMSILPFGRWLVSSKFVTSIIDGLTAVTRNRIAPKEEHDEQFRQSVSRIASWIGTLQRWITSYNFVMNKIAVIGILALSAFLYIWVFYPKVPQKMAGGAPEVVTLVVESEKIPLNDPDLQTMFSRDAGEADSATKRTISLPLLYATKEAYFVRLTSGKVVRLSSDSVTAVIMSSQKPKN